SPPNTSYCTRGGAWLVTVCVVPAMSANLPPTPGASPRTGGRPAGTARCRTNPPVGECDQARRIPLARAASKRHNRRAVRPPPQGQGPVPERIQTQDRLAAAQGPGQLVHGV